MLFLLILVVVFVAVVVAGAFRALYTPISASHLHIWAAPTRRHWRRLNFCIWLLRLSIVVFTVAVLLFASLSSGVRAQKS